jgi:hypothetical protein
MSFGISFALTRTLSLADTASLGGQSRKFLRADQGSLEIAVQNARAPIREAVRQYEQSRNELAFGGAMIDVLERGHTSAAVIGRRRAGDFAPADADDRKFGQLAARKDMPYLRSFLDDLAAGRYEDETGTLKLDQVTRRALLYPQKMTGTSNETFLLASPDEAMWWWRLGGSAQPCDMCPDLAAGSPYKAGELHTYPGNMDTPCMSGCQCSLERDDGLTGFTVPAMEGGEG